MTEELFDTADSQYSVLDKIESPADLKKLSSEELIDLATQIRKFLVQNVSKTGGHLGPNLGVIELTIALHKVYNCPTDTILFDTGHQSYVHKILTGRKNFDNLRKKNGLSGYPSRSESKCDVIENSHASTALAWADGISRAKVLSGDDSSVIAIIGDGALTGGMAWEAINNISEHKNRKLVIVVNDNGRSYAPTIGGLAKRFDALRSNVKYETFKEKLKKNLYEIGKPGRATYGLLHGLKAGVKDLVIPTQVFFEDLGIKYVGPVNGHDIAQLCEVFTNIREFDEPVIVHVSTEKGRGYTPAENDEHDRFHAIGKIHPETGLPVVQSRFGWTSVFADEIVKIGRKNSKVLAITAAMLEPVGLKNFAQEFPDRTFDVGIAEQFGATFSAGLSYSGYHPVFALYSTFLNRAYDQVLMDVALHNEAVTFVLDRSGITGDDGASHNGMWDMSIFRTVPNMAIFAPRDENTLRAGLNEAVQMQSPNIIRYPKGSVGQNIASIASCGRNQLLYSSIALENKDYTAQELRQVLAQATTQSSRPRIAVISIGDMAHLSLKVAEQLVHNHMDAVVLDPGWIWPMNAELKDIATCFDLVVTIEDGLVDGGIGSGYAEQLRLEDIFVPVKSFGIPDTFFLHQTRAQLLEEIRLTCDDIYNDCIRTVKKLRK